MATINTQRTSAFWAATRALDCAIDNALEHSSSAASGTTFVPAHLVGSARVPAYRRLGPVTIVDSDGNETRLGQDRTREMLAAAALFGILVWAAARSR
jgi:hypothetical protein